MGRRPQRHFARDGFHFAAHEIACGQCQKWFGCGDHGINSSKKTHPCCSTATMRPSCVIGASGVGAAAASSLAGCDIACVCGHTILSMAHLTIDCRSCKRRCPVEQTKCRPFWRRTERDQARAKEAARTERLFFSFTEYSRPGGMNRHELCGVGPGSVRF